MNTTYPLSWRLTQAVINYKISELARVSCPHCRSTFNAVSTHREIAPTLGNLKKLPLRGHKACLRRNLKDHENNISPRLRGFATPTGATLREYRALTAVPHSTFHIPPSRHRQVQLCESIVPSPLFHVPRSTFHHLDTDRCNFARVLCPHRRSTFHIPPSRHR